MKSAKSIPHVLPYQGSKRKIASTILNYVKFDIDSLYEPFAGSAALTLLAAQKDIAQHYHINDKLDPLAKIWELVINNPQEFLDRYKSIWYAQILDPKAYYIKIRDEFNKDKDPVKLYYLIARCVKNSVRFNQEGEFNQGPDNRRLGVHPDKIIDDVLKISKLMKNRVTITGLDFRDSIMRASSNDLVYMDPPWQGTSTRKDRRYAYVLNLEDLINELDSLNNRNVPYILSFDGVCGDKQYGSDLPKELDLCRVMINSGRSSQATLLGRSEDTIESLYLSPALLEKNQKSLENGLNENNPIGLFDSIIS